jgi:hypothetical protein
MKPELIKIGIWVLLLNREGTGYNATTYDCEYPPYQLLTCTWQNIPEELQNLSRGPWADADAFKEFLNWAHRIQPETILWEY